MPDPLGKVDLTAFSSSYADARAKFLEVAGPQVKSYLHPDQKGPAGEDLCLDVAVLGSPEASRVFAVGCGTHGIEGFAGSAALTRFSIFPTSPPGHGCCGAAEFGGWDITLTWRGSCSVANEMANEGTLATVAALRHTGDLRGAGASRLHLDCVALVQLCFSTFLKHHQSGPGS